jgi:DNA gyrase subunit A
VSGFVVTAELEKATRELSDLAAQLDANPTESARIEPRLASLLERIRRLTNLTGSSTPQRLGLWQPLPLSSPTFEEPAAVEAVQCDDDAGVISYDDLGDSGIEELPDVRDGLRPVERRILYTMQQEGLTHEARYKKCASVVGSVLRVSNLHGPSVIFDSLVRLAQDWSLRYPLIDGHGNFGSLDGDAPSSMRFTECRLSLVADGLLAELTRRDEAPDVLPVKLPHLLMNGTPSALALGLATGIPPHHAGELIDACVALITNRALETRDLLTWVKGPDFPTGGRVLNPQELRHIYETGHGVIHLRCEWTTEERRRGGLNIVVTSIPFAVNKGSLVERILQLFEERKLPSVANLRDESLRDVRIVLELTDEAHVGRVMEYLYEHAPLQTKVHVDLRCEVPNEDAPRRLDLKSMLLQFLDFRFYVVTKRLELERAQLEARLHLLAGFEKVCDAPEEAFSIIRKTETHGSANERLMKQLALSGAQAEAILVSSVSNFAELERGAVANQARTGRSRLDELNSLLSSESARWDLIREELLQLKPTFSGARRTKIGWESP